MHPPPYILFGEAESESAKATWWKSPTVKSPNSISEVCRQLSGKKAVLTHLPRGDDPRDPRDTDASVPIPQGLGEGGILTEDVSLDSKLMICLKEGFTCRKHSSVALNVLHPVPRTQLSQGNVFTSWANS